MEGASNSAPAQDSSGPTSTASMPIAPVYAGAMVSYNYSPDLRTSKKEFMSEQFYQRPEYGTDYPSPFVPTPMGPRGGIDVQDILTTGTAVDEQVKWNSTTGVLTFGRVLESGEFIRALFQ